MICRGGVKRPDDGAVLSGRCPNDTSPPEGWVIVLVAREPTLDLTLDPMLSACSLCP